MELTLPVNNLYINGRLISLDPGEFQLFREKLNIIPSEEDHYYVVKPDDEIGQIAYRYYSAHVSDPSKYWWLIADVESNNIQNPFDLTHLVGVEICVPDIARVLADLDNFNTDANTVF